MKLVHGLLQLRLAIHYVVWRKMLKSGRPLAIDWRCLIAIDCRGIGTAAATFGGGNNKSARPMSEGSIHPAD
jgi:hypothetical protein